MFIVNISLVLIADIMKREKRRRKGSDQSVLMKRILLVTRKKTRESSLVMVALQTAVTSPKNRIPPHVVAVRIAMTMTKKNFALIVIRYSHNSFSRFSPLSYY